MEFDSEDQVVFSYKNSLEWNLIDKKADLVWEIVLTKRLADVNEGVTLELAG